MMQRLRDEARDGDEALAAKLVSSIDKSQVDPQMQMRVRARMRQRRGLVPRGMRVRPLGALAVLLVLALFGVASAMVGRRLIAKLHSASPERAAPTVETPGTSPAPTTPAPAPTTPAPVATHRSSIHKTKRATTAAAAAPPAPSTVENSTESGPESQLIVEAFTALRSDRDPTRALGRVDLYLTRYPHGALVEEALILGIEAAQAGNPARAPQLARRYLELFPNGRFAKQAKRFSSTSP